MRKLLKPIIASYRYGKVVGSIRKSLLKKRNFTLISNNCWAGRVYQSFDMRFDSPTIGLFIMPKDYLKFISRLKYYVEKRVEVINIEESKHLDYLRDINYGGIIGRIDDIEIMFMHYDNPVEALDKWERRCKRINWERIIYKFNDQNLCTYEDIQEFDKLPLENKLCFTSKDYTKIKSNIFMREFKNNESIKDDIIKYKRYINIIGYINSIE